MFLIGGAVNNIMLARKIRRIRHDNDRSEETKEGKQMQKIP